MGSTLFMFVEEKRMLESIRVDDDDDDVNGVVRESSVLSSSSSSSSASVASSSSRQGSFSPSRNRNGSEGSESSEGERRFLVLSDVDLTPSPPSSQRRDLGKQGHSEYLHSRLKNRSTSSLDPPNPVISIMDPQFQSGGVVSKDEVTILCVQISGDGSYCVSSVNLFLRSLQDLIRKERRGRILEIDRKHVVVCWNYRRMSPSSHSILATKFALQLIRMSPSEEGSVEELGDSLKIHVGIGRGSLRVCTIGTRSMKKRCLEGRSVRVARDLSHFASLTEVPILCEESVYHRLLSYNARSSSTGYYRFVATQFDLLCCTARRKDPNTHSVFSVHIVDQPRSLEWMYLQPIEEDLARCRAVRDLFRTILHSPSTSTVPHYKLSIEKPEPPPASAPEPVEMDRRSETQETITILRSVGHRLRRSEDCDGERLSEFLSSVWAKKRPSDRACLILRQLSC